MCKWMRATPSIYTNCYHGEKPTSHVREFYELVFISMQPIAGPVQPFAKPWRKNSLEGTRRRNLPHGIFTVPTRGTYNVPPYRDSRGGRRRAIGGVMGHENNTRGLSKWPKTPMPQERGRLGLLSWCCQVAAECGNSGESKIVLLRHLSGVTRVLGEIDPSCSGGASKEGRRRAHESLRCV